MDEARGRDEWGRFSVLLATIVNSNPFRSGPPVEAAELSPYKSEAKRSMKSLVMITGSELAIRYGSGN